MKNVLYKPVIDSILEWEKKQPSGIPEGQCISQIRIHWDEKTAREIIVSMAEEIKKDDLIEELKKQKENIEERLFLLREE